MPGIARKVIICAAIDGLVIQPLLSKGQRPLQPVRLGYGDVIVTPLARDLVPDATRSNASFEAFGIVGLITVSKLSYLISITRRKQVAQFYGYPIYVVTEVAITPCASQASAEEAIAKTNAHLQRKAANADDGESSSDEDDAVQKPGGGGDGNDDVEDPAQSEDPSPSRRSLSAERSSVAENVITKKGNYGRFAQRWFSTKGWAQDQKRNMGLSHSPEETTASPSPENSEKDEPLATKIPLGAEDAGARASALLPKLLRTAQILFGTSRSFFFSYDLDITRSLARQGRPARTDEAVYRNADPVFFWNRHMLQPLSDVGQDSLVVPLMQGFVGQRAFVMDANPPQSDEGMADSVELSKLPSAETLPTSSPAETTTDISAPRRDSEKGFLLTIISRRSTKRAGLRYLRRGIDEDGYVANAVETEQFLSSESWDTSSRVHSFLQIRGSIPLFFKQSPYSLKPAPVLQHSSEANFIACKQHFDRLRKEYGKLQVVNLVEKHGIEAPIGEEYRRKIQRMNEDAEKSGEDAVSFEWFDFHAECRGMKFENVSLLLEKLRPVLDGFGSTVEVNGTLRDRQRGVLRTNCMDCLDRTNVCQSSFARYMLEAQLKEEGIDMSAQKDQVNAWFNTLWADNGDAISKQYASTAAMKGDYTRTRKRNYRGTLNDLGLSLTRFYNGMVNDYFSQAAIDFFLGNVTSMVFDEYEADMMTKDPAVSMAKMREQAIELCQKRVIADEREDFIGGWVLLSPRTSGTLRAQSLEEVVLLLTDAALYLCRFDWNLDKVSAFDRVALSHVERVRFGTYVTSTLSAAHLDEMKNVGFVVSYRPGGQDVTRTNTRTLSSLAGRAGRRGADGTQDGTAPKPVTGLAGLLGGASAPPPVMKLAFKAPYAQSSIAATGDAAPRLTEIQQVVTICAEIERLASESQLRPAPEGRERESLIERGDIISADEAKRSTGLFEQLGHSIKKMVWA